jgi:hypothetical protein
MYGPSVISSIIATGCGRCDGGVTTAQGVAASYLKRITRADFVLPGQVPSIHQVAGESLMETQVSFDGKFAVRSRDVLSVFRI